MKTTATTIIRAICMALVLTLICSRGASAQQIITFKSGLSVRAIVIDKTADSIRYQPVADPNVTLSAPMHMVVRISETSKIPPVKDYNFYKRKADKYTGVTVAGGVLLGAGAILTGVAVKMVNDSEFGTSEDATGVGLFLGSVVLVAGGGAMTIVGAVNLGKAHHDMRQFKYEVSPNPAISGVTVRLKF